VGGLEGRCAYPRQKGFANVVIKEDSGYEVVEWVGLDGRAAEALCVPCHKIRDNERGQQLKGKVIKFGIDRFMI